MEVTLSTESGFEITADVETRSTGFNGIGFYEYWGQKGYDKGIEEHEVIDFEFTEIVDPEGEDVDIKTVPTQLLEVWKEEIAELALQLV